MRSPLQETVEGAAPRKRRRVLPYVLVAGALAALVSASLAASITINSSQPIEFGQGSALASSCTSSAVVSLGTTVDANGSVTTSTITITGVSSSCFSAGAVDKYLRATLTGGAESAVRDQIVWHLVKVGPSDTAMTLRAAVSGGLTSADNSSSSNTSTIYPESSVTNGGMHADVLASNVASVQLETSDSIFTASV